MSGRNPAGPPALAALLERIVVCSACPRLVAWRRKTAREKVKRFASWTYWGRPVPPFGDPRARIVLVGLAPAAHGGNRTGRIFTGDRSGDFLFAALHRAGLASQPHSVARDDGLRLSDVWVTAAVRCAPPANKPTPGEQDRCRPFLVEELAHLSRCRVIVALGGLAWRAVLRACSAERGGPAFGHGRQRSLPDGRVLLGAYHPSQQNTFTGRLTPEMMDGILTEARRLAERPNPLSPGETGPPARRSRGRGGSPGPGSGSPAKSLR